MKVHAFHVIEGGKKWWVLHDLTKAYAGPVNGTRKQAATVWAMTYGTISTLITYRGLHRRSEAAMTIAELKRGNE